MLILQIIQLLLNLANKTEGGAQIHLTIYFSKCVSFFASPNAMGEIYYEFET